MERAQVGLIASIHFAQHVFRVLPPIIPVLALVFGYPLWMLGALVSAYYLGSGLGQTPMGVLVDRYDSRFVLPPSVGLMGAGYLVVAAAAGAPPGTVAGVETGYAVMAAGAFLSGLGASGVHPAGYPLISANVPPGSRGAAYGAWGSAAKLGDAAAPAAIAALVLVATWDEIFLVFGVAGLAFAGLLFAALSLDRLDTAAPEPAGRASAGVGRRTYLYPMAALFAFFVARAVAEKGFKAFLPTFLTEAYGYSFAVAGVHLPPESFANVYFTATFLVAAAVQLVTGRLVDRYDSRAVLVGYLVASAGAIALLAGGGLSRLGLLGVLALLGATFWGWTPARDALIAEVAPAEREGRTFGALHATSHLLGAVSPAVVGYLGGVGGLGASFLAIAGVTLVGALAVASLYSARVYHRTPAPE